MISKHLSSNSSKRFTSENVVAMRRCLTASVPAIMDGFDETCERRPDANAERLDDVFDRYLLGCVQ